MDCEGKSFAQAKQWKVTEMETHNSPFVETDARKEPELWDMQSGNPGPLWVLRPSSM